MSKLFVLDEAEGHKAPFLRGILTRSLQNAGLDFNEAYEQASSLRPRLEEIYNKSDSEETIVNTSDLRTHVQKILKDEYSEDISENYLNTSPNLSVIQITTADDQQTAYSRVLHQRCLQSCGIGLDDAILVSDNIHIDLLQQDRLEISSKELREITHKKIVNEIGKSAAARYLVWDEYGHKDKKPLLVLIGGTSGCGKSTLSTKIAGRLNIVRTQSTDMLREVMRMMIPKTLLPVLHQSSFEAWKTLRRIQEDARNDSRSEYDNLIDGYSAQAGLLSSACDAVIQRACRERVSLVLEGVHLYPALMHKIRQETDMIVVPLMKAILKPKQLRHRIKNRAKVSQQRSSEHYLKNFDTIWQLQSYLLDEADQLNIPIIHNNDLESDTMDVMKLINNTIAEELEKEGRIKQR